MKWIKYVPGLNVLYDIFFNGTPSLEAIKDSLNVQALLSALLIAIVISFPGAFEHDELKEASTRLSKCLFSSNPDPLAASDLLKREVFWSSLFLSNNVLMVVMVYLSLAGLKLQANNAEERFKAWYFYARFLLFFMTMFMMAGVLTFGRCTYFMFILKFPVSGDHENCTNAETADTSPFVFLRDVGNVIWLGTMASTVLILSCTHFSQLRMDEKQPHPMPITRIVPRPAEER
ncbi:unnamed protein product [Symbiodinium pilosum]|uniref:Uncharacterized protein n=1 Tax=Symbiodinium pilosum TaxID=2952 RepID=A0A812M7Y5_SYMPI|nr:unnamed protein product [Symbiodinium pilosum]